MVYTKRKLNILKICEWKGIWNVCNRISDFKCILICVYRSPHSDVYRFLDKLETLIGKVQSKRKKFIFCADWNISFLWDSVKLQALHGVLLSYNLINIVALPTRVTKNTSSVIDVT